MSEWEARMAERAKARGADWASVEQAKTDAHWAKLVRQERARQAQMTLGQAATWLHQEPLACACTGFPNCCVYVTQQANRLSRAAHIVAKLLAERKVHGIEQ